MRILVLSLCLACISSVASAAGVFRCETENGVEFSQFPCGQDAKEVTIKTTTGSATSLQGMDYEDTAEGIDKFLRSGKIERDREKLVTSIEDLEIQKQRAIDKVKEKMGFSKGQPVQSGVIDSVAARYNMLIQAERRKLKQLNIHEKQLEKKRSEAWKRKKRKDERAKRRAERERLKQEEAQRAIDEAEMSDEEAMPEDEGPQEEP
ncbi:DUF4124 domain-containing protein [Algicola sagamiensis]|uniref:DUF4124 domain-containing protein n=1 Tax=Algicola sagamiensis TaxID=163869 RepID=UPI00036A1124|nr:DUF4124 domain-containing protein [Algicola sagamiensis]